MKKHFKRMISLAGMFVMLVSTMFVGTVQVKADAGTTYAPYYDANTGKVEGAPVVGTVLMPGDVVSGSKLGDVTIVFSAFVFKEQIDMEGTDALVRNTFLF